MTSMKRILIVENGAGFGGALTSIGSFLHAVPPGDWEFYLLTSYRQDHIKPGGALVDVELLERKRRYGGQAWFERCIRPVCGKRAGNLAFLVDYLSTGRCYAGFVARYIAEHRIDLVHANNGTLINDAAIRGAKKAGVPVVVHVRATEYVGRTTAWLAKKVDHFLPISRFVAESIAALGVGPERMTIVPEGLDVNDFTAQADGLGFKLSVGLPADKPVLGMVGCLVDWKGHAVFLDACAKVFSQTDAVALIVGDTPDGNPQLRFELEEKSRSLGISERVWFVGHRNDVASAMAACDLIVHASTAPEPFGRVIIEGMSLGKAVVATNAGGPGEVINNGVDGLLVPCGDVGAMAEAITTVLENPCAASKIGGKGSLKVNGFYSVTQHVARILYRYEMLLGGAMVNAKSIL